MPPKTSRSTAMGRSRSAPNACAGKSVLIILLNQTTPNAADPQTRGFLATPTTRKGIAN
jgi:hypothetical protein